MFAKGVLRVGYIKVSAPDTLSLREIRSGTKLEKTSPSADAFQGSVAGKLLCIRP